MNHLNVNSLANALQRDFVFFDIEHTSGSSCRVFEFGAVTVSASGEISEFQASINPGAGSVMSSFASKITGATLSSLEKFDLFDVALGDFLLRHKTAIWVGFNSNSCDVPIMRSECERYGMAGAMDVSKLDLMKFGGVKGSLSVRHAHYYGDSAYQKHSALDDARMTLELMDAQLRAGVDFLTMIRRKQISLS